MRFACGVLILGLLAGPAAVTADPPPVHPHPNRPQLRALMHQLHKLRHWRMLEVTPHRSTRGQPRMRLKLLGPNGRVRVLEVDPGHPDLNRLK